MRFMGFRAPPRRRERRVSIVNLPNDINNTITATDNFLGPHESFVYADTRLCLACILQPTCKDGNRIMIADWRAIISVSPIAGGVAMHRELQRILSID
jgi:hypothetical protein